METFKIIHIVHRENKVKIPIRPMDNAPCQPDTESPLIVSQPARVKVAHTQVQPARSFAQNPSRTGSREVPFE